MVAPLPLRSFSPGSSARRHGRISTSRARRSARRSPTSARAGRRAGACGCSTSWCATTTKAEGRSRPMTEVLIYRAPVPEDAGSYERLVLLFDGEDDEAVAAAREQWKAAAARGFEVTYWQTDEAGRWQRRG